MLLTLIQKEMMHHILSVRFVALLGKATQTQLPSSG